MNILLDRMVNDTVYRLKIGAGIIGITLLIWGIIHISTYREHTQMSVAKVAWDTKIDVYQYQTNHEGDWYVPTGGRETDHYRKQRGTRKVLDHYDHVKRTKSGDCSYSGTGKNKRRVCQPDTTYYDDVPVYRYDPVYDTWYEYDIDEWNHIQPLVAKGINHEWRFPDTTDATYNDAPILGNKKLGMRSTHFYIEIIGNNKTMSLDMPESQWMQYNVGNWCDVTFNWFGSVLTINKRGSF